MWAFAIWDHQEKTLFATRRFKTAIWALSSNINYQNVSKNQKNKR